jgi:hypothetical protein
MEQVIGNIFIRTMFFAKKGDKVDGHTHNFPHATLIPQGAVNVKRRKKLDGKLVLIGDDNYAAKFIAGDVLPTHILIEADVHHEITALEDNTVCMCVFAHRDPRTGEVVQDWNGWMGAAV